VTLSEESFFEENHLIESDRESINTASFVYNRSAVMDHNDHPQQQVPAFNKLQSADSLSNPSENTPGN
jgi:hypothetical protein